MRDLSKAKFDAECRRLSYKPQGFPGYYCLGDTGVWVSIQNAGTSRRAQLVYLILEHKEVLAKQGGTGKWIST